MMRVITLICLLAFATETAAFAGVAPAAAGWGNLVVPGLGATLRGRPFRGLLEATSEIGLYYGGTFYAKEGEFTIDGTVLVPSGRNIVKPLLGQFMQEIGLKLHMFDTFYNYQQAAMDPDNAEHEREYQQPLYKGTWKDVLAAPFQPENLLTPWVYIPVVLSTTLLMYQYNTAPVAQHGYVASGGEELLYLFTQGIGVPLGSAFGEEVLYRGFMQREFRLYTNSALLSIAMETALFTMSHQPSLRPGAAVGGVYFGLITNHFNGNLEPGIAAHFWIDFISGALNYLLFRRTEGKSVPFSAQVTIPF